MSKNCIVGYTGFVGSNLLSFYPFDFFFNSKNFEDARGLTFDTLFFCGVPAVKWLANKFPEQDSATISIITDILKTIQVKKIILISTIDVYEYVDNQMLNEDYDCDWINNHTYGRNRYLFEKFVQEQFPDKFHIIRLPALFGKGLKKNVIYDLIHNNQVENISALTKFQWYDLGWLKMDIDRILEKNIRIANLFTEPLETMRIIELFKYPIETFDSNKSTLTYNVTTKYSPSGYIRTKEEVLHNIKCFLDFEKMDKSHLVVSNICVKHISQKQFAHILQLHGIQHVQIAPTTLIKDWSDLPNIDFSVFTERGIQVYSLQSVCYGISGNIFDSDTSSELLFHMQKLVDVAIKKGIQVFVFGCPRNRKILDALDVEGNERKFVSFFRKLGDYIGERDLTICLENNSKQYGCNFLNFIKDVGHWVQTIQHPKIKMMVDVGNAMMEQDTLEDMSQYKDYIFNIDVANENMAPLLKISDTHKQFQNILAKMGYSKKINLEMQISNAKTAAEELEVLRKSIVNFYNLFVML